ncbi:hypothetical protein NDU88_002302 [Pleurodeles waltl]|uniref:Uncharacterized protein n=1 Tax=Pleurodeles waltl TaxID=8319 RepID=A0AAV7P9J3_PLEWA|nr:hypothetical protein NDU88_002302 [Pleurodeles waltl]
MRLRSEEWGSSPWLSQICLRPSLCEKAGSGTRHKRTHILQRLQVRYSGDRCPGTGQLSLVPRRPGLERAERYNVPGAQLGCQSSRKGDGPGEQKRDTEHRSEKMPLTAGEEDAIQNPKPNPP